MKLSIVIALACLGACVGFAKAEEAEKEAEPVVRSSVKLGWTADARLLMTHADDVGLCQPANDAVRQAQVDGRASSCSVMMPCPWAYDWRCAGTGRDACPLKRMEQRWHDGPNERA